MLSSTVIRMSGAYIAFLIGSGFATGQEAMQFFVGHGWWGIAGIGLCSVLMIYTCWSLLRAGRREELITPEAVFVFYCGPYLGRVLAWYTILLIIAVAGVMFAGAAATLRQVFGLPTMIGAGAMAGVVLVTMLLGLERLLTILAVVGPAIIAVTLLVTLMTLANSGPGLASELAAAPDVSLLRASSNWIFSSLLYVGLTLPGLASFLPMAAKVLRSQQEVRIVSVLGPCLLFGVLLLVCLALAAEFSRVSQEQVPILALAGRLPGFAEIFAGIIFLGIFSTITPLLWSVCRRFATEDGPMYRGLVVGLALVGWAGGTLLPFDQLLNWIYPTVGYAGLVLLCCLLFTDFVGRPQGAARIGSDPQANR